MTGGGLTLDERRAAGLAPTLPPPPTIAPGLIVTVGDCEPVQRDLAVALPMLRSIRPNGVMLHTNPGPEDAPTVAALRAALPDVRVWIQAPANVLAGLNEAKALDRVRGWVRASVDLGAEVLSLNGEGASHPGGVGWKPGQPLDAAGLAARARALLAAMADEARGRLALAWSSHDRILSHALPWAAILGAGSPVTLTLPQVYADPADGTAASVGGARARYQGTAAQHTLAVARGLIRADFGPTGAGFVLYAQSHHHGTAAACYLHDQAALSASWTIRRDGALCDAAGLLALRADAELRRQVGHAPGRIARYQASVGIPADGIVGPRTLAKLGLATT